MAVGWNFRSVKCDGVIKPITNWPYNKLTPVLLSRMNVELKLLGFVALKSHFERYLCCENLLFSQFLVIDRIEIKEWEIFELYVDCGFYALRAHNGNWLCVTDNILTCEKHFNDRCFFKMDLLEKHDDFAYKVALQTYMGTWICANRTIPTLRDHCLDWEEFTLEILPNYPRSPDIINLELLSGFKSATASQTYLHLSNNATQTEPLPVVIPICEVPESPVVNSEDEWLQIENVEE